MTDALWRHRPDLPANQSNLSCSLNIPAAAIRSISSTVNASAQSFRGLCAGRTEWREKI